MEYAYLIKSGDNYKIGKSNNPQRRLNSIMTSNLNAELICYGTGVKEKELHHIFSNKRIKGEWFNLNETDIQKIILLIKDDNVRPEVYDKLDDIELLNKLMTKITTMSLRKVSDNPDKYPKSYAYYRKIMGDMYMSIGYNK